MTKTYPTYLPISSFYVATKNILSIRVLMSYYVHPIWNYFYSLSDLYFWTSWILLTINGGRMIIPYMYQYLTEKRIDIKYCWNIHGSAGVTPRVVFISTTGRQTVGASYIFIYSKFKIARSFCKFEYYMRVPLFSLYVIVSS